VSSNKLTSICESATAHCQDDLAGGMMSSWAVSHFTGSKEHDFAVVILLFRGTRILPIKSFLKTRSDTLHLSARRTQSDVSGNVRERTKKTAFAKTSTVNVCKNAQLQNLNISFPPILNANFDAVNFVATRDKKLR